MSVLLYDPIKTMRAVSDSVLVAFSGGKDSVVTLDLCAKYFDRVEAFFMYLVPGLEFQERMLTWYERKYGIHIHRLPHMDTSTMLRYGAFTVPDYNVPQIGINDIYDYMRRETGIPWIAAGERISDSIWRRAMIKHSGSIDWQRGRFYPLAEWNKNEVMQYIKKARLKLGEDSKKLGFSFRSLDGKELSVIKRIYPDDYKKILRVFPFAEASVLRYEKYGEKEQISAL